MLPRRIILRSPTVVNVAKAAQTTRANDVLERIVLDKGAKRRRGMQLEHAAALRLRGATPLSLAVPSNE
jgi:hypothetical protein